MKAGKNERRRALVIAAHPDDPEYGCAGTVACWAAEGAQITYLLLTSGDKGSKDPAVRPGRLAAVREKEQAQAAAKLGVSDLVFLRHPDGMLENTMELRRELVGIIRQRKPHAVFAIDPWRHYQTHPDHRAAGLAALDAVYAAKEVNLFAEQLVYGVDPWRVKEVYLFWTDAPDFWEDISESIERRIAALLRHSSQVGKDRKGHSRWIRETSRSTAKKAGLAFEYAEAFKLLKF
ncbi:MAG: PIG-L family deacetylase [Spirochaetes bacterium]|nr:PIG-L family deacetylase [Spirochaetota bacterium]